MAKATTRSKPTASATPVVSTMAANSVATPAIPEGQAGTAREASGTDSGPISEDASSPEIGGIQSAAPSEEAGRQSASDLIEVLVVTGPAKGARRAGLRFGPEPTVLPVTILREDEIESIENDKRLSAKREQRAASDI